MHFLLNLCFNQKANNMKLENFLIVNRVPDDPPPPPNPPKGEDD